MAETILITGANRGIGLELARQFTNDGWGVIACCRRPEEADELTALEKENAGKLTVHRLDVTDAGQIQELARSLKGRAIDILLNNAGVGGGRQQSFGETDEETWMNVFRVNVFGPMKVTEALAENVASGDRKIIATIGSIMGSLSDNTSGGFYIYRSSKAAVHMVVRSMALDLKSRGITSVVLHPGWVKTDMGGPGADITVEESAKGLKQVLLGVGPKDNGRFFDYRGQERPW